MCKHGYTRRVIIILLLVLGACTRLAAYPDSSIQQMYASQPFEKLYKSVYNCRSAQEIELSYAQVAAWIEQQAAEELTKAAAQTRAALVVGKQYVEEEYLQDMQRAAMLFDYALALLNYTNDTSQSVELLINEGELYGSYFLINQSKYLFSYGRKSHELIQQVWKMDQSNPRAVILKSNQLIYTPKLFGGNMGQARELLVPLLSQDLLDVDEFTVYLCLGIIDKDSGRNDSAREYFKKALSIYPGNNYVRELMEQL
jgi:tetratricopeptide (TPR) repeat protein